MVTKWRAISISLHLTASLFACSLPEKGGIFLEVTGWQMVAQPWRNLCGGTCAYFLGCVLASHSLLPAPHALHVFLKNPPNRRHTLQFTGRQTVACVGRFTLDPVCVSWRHKRPPFESPSTPRPDTYFVGSAISRGIRWHTQIWILHIRFSEP